MTAAGIAVAGGDVEWLVPGSVDAELAEVTDVLEGVDVTDVVEVVGVVVVVGDATP